MLVLSTFGTAILGASALTISAAYYATHQHKSYLKEYIAKGVFMHDEEHHDMFDSTLHEVSWLPLTAGCPSTCRKVHTEHDEEHAIAAEHDPEHQGEVHDDHPAVREAYLECCC